MVYMEGKTNALFVVCLTGGFASRCKLGRTRAVNQIAEATCRAAVVASALLKRTGASSEDLFSALTPEKVSLQHPEGCRNASRKVR